VHGYLRLPYELEGVILHDLGQLLVRGRPPDGFCLAGIEVPGFLDVAWGTFAERRVHAGVDPVGVFSTPVGLQLFLQSLAICFAPAGVEEKLPRLDLGRRLPASSLEGEAPFDTVGFV
jgi:hypothetical protein